jgi:hypothetical protein
MPGKDGGWGDLNDGTWSGWTQYPDGSLFSGLLGQTSLPKDSNTANGKITFKITSAAYKLVKFTDPEHDCTPCVGVDIFFAYEGSGSGLNWIQSVTVNGNEYVDNRGASTPFYLRGSEVARFTQGNTFYFGDKPGRPPNSDWDWQAQTSLVAPNGSGGYYAVGTFTWGFKITGGNAVLYPFVPASPDTYQQGQIASARQQ